MPYLPRRLRTLSILTDPIVSIIVIGHSVREELVRCLDSIAAHGDLPAEVIYVDNASTDDTLAWLEATWPQVRVVALARNRFGVAREHGLRLARGRYTMFLDSDAQLTAGALPRMVEALDAHPEWGMVGPKLVYDDGSLQLSCRRYPPVALPFLRRPPLDRWFDDGKVVRHHLMADDDHGRTRPVLYVISACQLFRTDLARAAGPFDEVALAWGWEDTDWCLRIRDAGGEVVYLPSATVIHTYRRLTAAKPVSTGALRQLRAHARFQLKYLRRRGELIALSERMDAEAAA